MTSLHLGLKWGKLASRKTIAPMVAPGFPRVMTMGLVALIAAYGQYAFFKHNIASYLVRKVEFVNYPLGVSFWRFELEYLAMMVLFALVARNLGKLLGSPKNSSR